MTKGDETRAVILDRALALASQQGLGGLSIGVLAKEVGLSKSGLFAHFDSKENLLVQILDNAAGHFIERVMAPALRQPRGVARVRAIFDNWLEWEQWASGLPGGCPFIAAASELDDQPGPVRDRLVALQKDLLESVAIAARSGIGEGDFVPDLDVQQFAYDLYAIVLAFHHFHRLMHEPGAEERARVSFDRLLDSASVA